MDLQKAIVELLRRQPGLTDRQITDAVRGTSEPQQSINQTCRRLNASGVSGILRRERRPDGLIGNFLLPGPVNDTTFSQTAPIAARTRAESGRLICDTIDFNRATVASSIVEAATEALREPSRWHRLVVHRRLYFATPDGPLHTKAGWYIIRDDLGNALYVGKAENLNARLNSSNGSLDNFAHSGRSQDPVRNFIKAFLSNGYVEDLRVGLVLEDDVQPKLNLEPAGSLSSVDRGNVEKVLGIFRQVVVNGLSNAP